MGQGLGGFGLLRMPAVWLAAGMVCSQQRTRFELFFFSSSFFSQCCMFIFVR